MWQTLISLCLTLSGSAPRRPALRRLPAFHRPSCRPRLEALEDRCLLSAGALDPTFGNGAGYVTTALSRYGDSAYATVIQPDGKIIAVGWVQTKANLGGYTFGVARYNTDGSLDTTFGSGGTALGGAFVIDSQWVALYPSTVTDKADAGKIVVEGWYNGQFALERFNTNGTVDATFGSNKKMPGEVITSLSDGSLTGPGGLVVTSAGQIVVASDNNTDIVLARYNANGSLDTTFGTGGQVVTPLAQGSSNEDTLIQQPDGKLVLAGATAGSVLVMRYNANGSLDSTFGTGGLATSAVGSGAFAIGAAVYPNAGTLNDGKIVVVGFTSPVNYPNGREWLVERYNPNGTLDSTFGSGGEVINPSLSQADAVAIAADGKPVVYGVVGPLVRYNADGSPDGTFGTGGIVNPPFHTGGVPWGSPLAIQSNGDIIQVGEINGRFAVARYLPSEPEIGSFTASASTVASGSSVMLTASNISDGNPNATIKQVTFYYYDSSGNNVTLGTGTQSNGAWTLNYTVNLPSGTYTLFAQAEDSDGVFGDPLALTLAVQ